VWVMKMCNECLVTPAVPWCLYFFMSLHNDVSFTLTTTLPSYWFVRTSFPSVDLCYSLACCTLTKTVTVLLVFLYSPCNYNLELMPLLYLIHNDPPRDQLEDVAITRGYIHGGLKIARPTLLCKRQHRSRALAGVEGGWDAQNSPRT
jgi:hypothetical protein